MKKTIIAIVVVILIILGIYFFTRNSSSDFNNQAQTQNTEQNQEAANTAEQQDQAEQSIDKTKTVIGTSVSGTPIAAYHYGEGSDELLFVGGIHGGYEWNTSLVAYQLMDYLAANPSAVPANVQVTIIPVLNPDGLAKVTGTTGRFTAANVSSSSDLAVAGRFNANNVDLNRNFDCDWQADAVWQTKSVSGGTAAFSEPESAAVKSYIDTHNPKAVVVWYSAAGGVFASSCHNGVSAETNALTSTYAKASGYKAYQSFDFYATTGDMVNWLAKENIPAISVLLTNHTDIEWTKNLAGIKALFAYYKK